MSEELEIGDKVDIALDMLESTEYIKVTSTHITLESKGEDSTAETQSDIPTVVEVSTYKGDDRERIKKFLLSVILGE